MFYCQPITQLLPFSLIFDQMQTVICHRSVVLRSASPRSSSHSVLLATAMPHKCSTAVGGGRLATRCWLHCSGRWASGHPVLVALQWAVGVWPPGAGCTAQGADNCNVGKMENSLHSVCITHHYLVSLVVMMRTHVHTLLIWPSRGQCLCLCVGASTSPP